MFNCLTNCQLLSNKRTEISFTSIVILKKNNKAKCLVIIIIIIIVIILTLTGIVVSPVNVDARVPGAEVDRRISARTWSIDRSPVRGVDEVRNASLGGAVVSVTRHRVSGVVLRQPWLAPRCCCCCWVECPACHERTVVSRSSCVLEDTEPPGRSSGWNHGKARFLGMGCCCCCCWWWWWWWWWWCIITPVVCRQRLLPVSLFISVLSYSFGTSWRSNKNNAYYSCHVNFLYDDDDDDAQSHRFSSATVYEDLTVSSFISGLSYLILHRRGTRNNAYYLDYPAHVNPSMTLLLLLLLLLMMMIMMMMMVVVYDALMTQTSDNTSPATTSLQTSWPVYAKRRRSTMTVNTRQWLKSIGTHGNRFSRASPYWETSFSHFAGNYRKIRWPSADTLCGRPPDLLNWKLAHRLFLPCTKIFTPILVFLALSFLS